MEELRRAHALSINQKVCFQHTQDNQAAAIMHACKKEQAERLEYKEASSNAAWECLSRRLPPSICTCALRVFCHSEHSNSATCYPTDESLGSYRPVHLQDQSPVINSRAMDGHAPYWPVLTKRGPQRQPQRGGPPSGAGRQPRLCDFHIHRPGAFPVRPRAQLCPASFAWAVYTQSWFFSKKPYTPPGAFL